MIDLRTLILLSLVMAVTCLRELFPLRHHHHNQLYSQKYCAHKTALCALPSSSLAIMDKCMTIKCPFFRRRAIDSLEFIVSIINFVLLTRHKSIPIAFNTEVTTSAVGTIKLTNQTVAEIARCILNDWRGKIPNGFDGKGITTYVAYLYHHSEEFFSPIGYYITGALTKSIYRDDCYFDGPDPDMPVSGLQKYLLSVSNLFDRRKSRADITRPVVVNEVDRTIQVFWRLEGVLNLPWHPSMKPWTGKPYTVID